MLLKGEAGALKAEVDMRMGSAASSLPPLWALDATLEMKPRQIQGKKVVWPYATPLLTIILTTQTT